MYNLIILVSKDIVIYGEGYQTRDFIYVEDIVSDRLSDKSLSSSCNYIHLKPHHILFFKIAANTPRKYDIWTIGIKKSP